MPRVGRGFFGGPPPATPGSPGTPATNPQATNPPGANAPGTNPTRAGGPGSPGTIPGFGNRAPAGPVTSIPPQDLADVSKNWPAGNIDIRIGDFMFRPHQKWTITPVDSVGGYPGSPYFKITIAGTNRALASTADAEVIAVPTFTGSPEQLWRIDQLIDGTYRIMPKIVPNSKEPLALTAVGGSTPTLAKFDPKSDKSRWNFKMP